MKIENMSKDEVREVMDKCEKRLMILRREDIHRTYEKDNEIRGYYCFYKNDWDEDRIFFQTKEDRDSDEDICVSHHFSDFWWDTIFNSISGLGGECCEGEWSYDEDLLELMKEDLELFGIKPCSDLEEFLRSLNNA